MRRRFRRLLARSSNTRRISNGCVVRARESCWPARSMPEAGAILTRNWLHFGRILRGLGFDAGPTRMVPFLTTLTVIDIGRSDDLRTAVRIHFARRRADLRLLDRALATFLGRPAVDGLEIPSAG